MKAPDADDPGKWLDKNAPGYSSLSEGERDAITHFVFFWSLFEAQMLGGTASPISILRLAKNLSSYGQLKSLNYQGPFMYFKDRYCRDGGLNSLFEGLHFRQHDNRTLVEKVLSGEESDPTNILAAVLLIVYRLRNNLFHGLKWRYELRDQKDNFENANYVLMQLLHLSERSPD